MKNQNTSWSEKEDNELLEFFDEKNQALANLLGRSKNAIASRKTILRKKYGRSQESLTVYADSFPENKEKVNPITICYKGRKIFLSNDVKEVSIQGDEVFLS